MRVLAFDCSAASGSVAVVDGGVTVHAEEFECPRGRGGAFFPALERAVRAAGTFDRIAVGIGPGSYNGLRAAIAAAEGLRLARGVEVVGVASVRALPGAGADYIAVSDARGGVFYYGQVRGRALGGDFELLGREELAARLAAEPALPVLVPAAIPGLPGAVVARPDAAILAALAMTEPPTAGAVEPIYLKPAHITAPNAAKRAPGLRPPGK